MTPNESAPSIFTPKNTSRTSRSRHSFLIYFLWFVSHCLAVVFSRFHSRTRPQWTHFLFLACFPVHGHLMHCIAGFMVSRFWTLFRSPTFTDGLPIFCCIVDGQRLHGQSPVLVFHNNPTNIRSTPYFHPYVAHPVITAVVLLKAILIALSALPIHSSHSPSGIPVTDVGACTGHRRIKALASSNSFSAKGRLNATSGIKIKSYLFYILAKAERQSLNMGSKARNAHRRQPRPNAHVCVKSESRILVYEK